MARPTAGDWFWVAALTIFGFAMAHWFWGFGLGEALVAAAVVFLARLAWAAYARSTVNRYRR